MSFVLKRLVLDFLSGVYPEGWSFHAQFHHTGTQGGLTCCLATDCNNLQFTLKQLRLNRRERMGALSIIADWLSACGCWAARAAYVCVCTSAERRGLLSVADSLSWILSSSASSTTLQTVAPRKTASLARSSWNTWLRWAPLAPSANTTVPRLGHLCWASVCDF